VSLRSRETRAIEYRRMAAHAADLAQASPLSHVREKHEVAAARWAALAELDERPSDAAPKPAPPALEPVAA
jgi:hypothetical protein